jgi:CBS domain-containing protein
MKVAECMTVEVQVVGPDQPIREAARLMAEIDAGVLPVADHDRLIGMMTDRDIAVRAVAEGRGPETPVSQVMSGEVMYCFDDQEAEDVLRNMADLKLRRLPVVNRDKRLVGIVSLSDLAQGGDQPPAADALRHIAEPGGPHRQTLH